MALPRRRSRRASLLIRRSTLGIWLAGDPDVAELPAGFAVADKSAITVDGAAGVYFASTDPAWPA